MVFNSQFGFQELFKRDIYIFKWNKRELYSIRRRRIKLKRSSGGLRGLHSTIQYLVRIGLVVNASASCYKNVAKTPDTTVKEETVQKFILMIYAYSDYKTE